MLAVGCTRAGAVGLTPAHGPSLWPGLLHGLGHCPGKQSQSKSWAEMASLSETLPQKSHSITSTVLLRLQGAMVSLPSSRGGREAAPLGKSGKWPFLQSPTSSNSPFTSVFFHCAGPILHSAGSGCGDACLNGAVLSSTGHHGNTSCSHLRQVAVSAPLPQSQCCARPWKQSSRLLTGRP